MVEKKDIADLKHWLDLVTIARRCCGNEMQISWRSALHALNQAPLTSMAPRTHSCQRYKFSTMERKMRNLEVGLFQSRLTEIGTCDCSIRIAIKEQQNSSLLGRSKCASTLDTILHPDLNPNLKHYSARYNFVDPPALSAPRTITIRPHDTVDAMDNLRQLQLETVWVQYGSSGEQFMSMTSFAWYLFGFENVTVGLWGDALAKTLRDRSNSNSTSRPVKTYLREEGNLITNKPVLVVTRAESYKDLKEVNLSISEYSLFVSMRDDVERKHSTEVTENLRVNTKSLPLIQRYDDARHDEFRTYIDVYGELFNVTDTAVLNSMYRWLSGWRLTQVCCSGRYMSDEWRSALLLIKGNPLSSMPDGTHTCQRYSFSEVEQRMRTIEHALFGKVLTIGGSCECSINQLLQPDEANRIECEKGYLDEILTGPIKTMHLSISSGTNTRHDTVSAAGTSATVPTN